jgi:flagellar protein FlgJ
MLGPTSDLSGKFALDTNSLADLKQSAKTGSPEATKQAATQFESMFINMMMKSMRDATPQDGLTDSQDTKTYTAMLDQQLSQKLAKRGIGLADVLVRQLGAQGEGRSVSGTMSGTGGQQAAQEMRLSADADSLPTDRVATGSAATSGASGSARGTASGKPAHVRAFQEKLADAAEQAEQATGVPAKFMLGQAALETGWGKRVIRNSDGTSSNNLFGIKAGPGWKGKVATAVTTEYVHGKPHARVEKFRAYDSYADAFKDYANMLGSNPRYAKVLQHGGDATMFAHGLQRAGYATDPQYAAKLSSIIKHSLA